MSNVSFPFCLYPRSRSHSACTQGLVPILPVPRLSFPFCLYPMSRSHSGYYHVTSISSLKLSKSYETKFRIEKAGFQAGNVHVLDFCCVFLSQNGDPSLASIHVYPHACLESLHETSRHAHNCRQSQLPCHYSRVREEAEGRENTSVSKISNSRFLVTRELYPCF